MFSLKKHLHFLSSQNCKIVCRRCLNCFTCANLLVKHKPTCEEQDISSIRTANESHQHWKRHFHKSPLYSTNYANFEADSEVENSGQRNKTTNSYKQNPIFNGYYIVSELDDVSQNDSYESPSEYNNVD